MKILFLARELDYGGTQRQLSLLASGLARQGHEIAVAVFYAGGPLTHSLENSDVRVIDLGKGSHWSICSFMFKLIGTVRRFAPDIVHGYLPVPNILCGAIKPLLRRGTRVVFGIRASNVDHSRYSFLAAQSYRLEPWMACMADLVIYNSVAGLRTAVQRGLPESRCEVIHNGVDLDLFKPDPHARHELRAEWGFGEGVRLVGLVGRLDPMKGHETFLNAAVQLVSRRGDIHFIFVGDGPENFRNTLRDRSMQLGINNRVTWVNARTDIWKVYNALDLLVSASIYGEGLPNVLGEAMACEIRVVATDVGDSKLIVGNYGHIVPPGDPESLASAIETALTTPPGDMRKHIETLFGSQKLNEKTERALEAML